MANQIVNQIYFSINKSVPCYSLHLGVFEAGIHIWVFFEFGIILTKYIQKILNAYLQSN